MREVSLPDGEKVPALGMGTWFMGDDPSQADAEADALRYGLDLGMTLVDTAEMYAHGGAEEVVGKALAGRRDEVFLVSKVLPHNASRSGIEAACEGSMARMGVECIDLYLLHWPGSYPLSETIEGFERLRDQGKIRHWGVSNFDTDAMRDLMDAGGEACATNQILYNVSRRGPEFDLMPYCADRNISVMAYSPLEQGRLRGHSALAVVAEEHGVSDLQVALAWVLQRDGVIAIPKSASRTHLKQNYEAASLHLSPEDLARLEADFPAPSAQSRLEVL